MSDIVRLDNQRESGKNKGTFEISVRYMQNSTWQGQILWVEENRKQNFRSALEMLKLMDEALSESLENPNDLKAINW